MTSDRWQRIEAVYHAARLRPAPARAAYVRDACADDEDLRREVESLLSQDAMGDRLLEQPTAIVAGLADDIGRARMTVTHVGAADERIPGSVIGQRFGSYEIVARLGAGGMGEVYRARDTKLRRDVAVKLLPAAMTVDPERLARFEREARVLASLNHPHIGAIYGLEALEGGAPALILELIPGETLADRILRGPIPVATALTYARQIADALDAAHGKGIIHRDLKPANIHITPNDLVKILDFGLARVTAVSQRDESQAPTLTIDPTREGVVMGTAAYMSPEQARGQIVDKRTDIWAFGCVLFEMLTGRSLFGAATLSDTLVAVLGREPDFSALPSATPATVGQLLQRCLEKDASRRLGNIREAVGALTDAVALDAGLSRPQSTDGAAPRPHSRARLAMLAGAAFIALAALASALVMSRRQAPLSIATEAPVQLTDFADSAVAPSLSHDGRMVTFVRGATFARTAPTGQVYVKLLPGGEPLQLTQGTGAGYPTFSPDDARIVYSVVMPGLKWDSWEVPAHGGSPQPFLTNASGLTWLSDRRLMYASIKSGLYMGIVTSTLSRDNVKDVYFPASAGGMAHRPAPSPDGNSVLVVEMDRAIWQPCRLVPANGSAPGYPVGPPRAPCTSAAWSPDGRWMYFSSNAGGAFHVWRQRYPDGKPAQITAGPTQQEGTAITPDGQYLITSMGFDRATIWQHDASGDRQLTDEGYATRPSMAESGLRLYYLLRADSSQGESTGELWAADRATRSRQRVVPGLTMTNYALAPDGKKILFTSSGHAGGDGIWMADLERRTPPRQLTHGLEPRAFFGAPGEIVYMSADGYLSRMRDDGTNAERISPDPIVFLMTVSPDGQWAAVIRPEGGKGGGTSAEFRSLRGGSSFAVCNAKCSLGPASLDGVLPFNWGSDGMSLFASLQHFQAGDRRTVVLPYRSDVPLNKLWPKGLKSDKDILANPGAAVIDADNVYPAADSSTYLTWRRSFQSNLYRVRLPN